VEVVDLSSYKIKTALNGKECEIDVTVRYQIDESNMCMIGIRADNGKRNRTAYASVRLSTQCPTAEEIMRLAKFYELEDRAIKRLDEIERGYRLINHTES
jgi:GTP cyclohydrolase FolE2